MTTNVTVSIDLREPSTQVFSVKISFVPKFNFLRFSLPVWTPGSYVVRDHVQNLYELLVEQDSRNITLSRVDPSTWEANLSSKEAICIKYKIEARDLTVRTCYLDSDLASLCLSGAVVQINGFRNSEHLLDILLPPNWRLFAPLSSKNSICSSSYDELLDTPIHAGQFNLTNFRVDDFKHDFLLIGKSPKGLPNNLIGDIQKICCSVSRLMRSSPPSGNSYMFVLFILEQGYGGLEHNNGAVLHFSWKTLCESNGYRKLLQLVGHEYLHQWNVRRLRPLDYLTYDYSKPVISDCLWFAEGVTSYFDMCITYIAGLSTLDDYMYDLSYELTLFLKSPGRKIQSLSDSSREAWIKLYKSKPYSRDNQISYYRLGTFLSLCIDVRLRKVGSSLSSILRLLWNEYGIKFQGYTRDNILEVIARFDKSLSMEIPYWLDIPDQLPLLNIFNELGLCIKEITSEEVFTGISFSNKSSDLVVNRVQPNSPGHKAGIAVYDEIIAVDGYRIRDIRDFDNTLPLQGSVTVIYSRRGIIKDTVVDLNANKVERWDIKLSPHASENSIKLRDSWMKFL